jgi:hypothetical protein
MSEMFDWYVGIDWASEVHQVCLVDDRGVVRGERAVRHSGEELAALAAWLIATTGAAPERIAVGIELPHGPVVESLMERGFAVHAINPKQLDRFRDRFSVSGAKDDRRDARVLGDSLRTDTRCFRRLKPDEPRLIELREWLRMAEECKHERIRLTNRMREQLWRYYPQILELSDDLSAAWFLDLWALAPTPAKALRVRESTIAKLLRKHRVRRFDAAEVMRRLRRPALTVAPGTVEAASVHVGALRDRLRLVNRQITAAERRVDQILTELAALPEEPRQELHRANASGLQPASARRSLSLEPCRGPRRRHLQGALSGPAQSRPQSWPGAAHGRRPAAGNRLRHAARPQPVRSATRRADTPSRLNQACAIGRRVIPPLTSDGGGASGGTARVKPVPPSAVARRARLDACRAVENHNHRM